MKSDVVIRPEVLRLRQINTHCENVRSIHSDRSSVYVHGAADHQSGSDQKHHAQCHLEDDEDTGKVAPACTSAASLSALLLRVDHSPFPPLHRSCQPTSH